MFGISIIACGGNDTISIPPEMIISSTNCSKKELFFFRSRYIPIENNEKSEIPILSVPIFIIHLSTIGANSRARRRSRKRLVSKRYFIYPHIPDLMLYFY